MGCNFSHKPSTDTEARQMFISSWCLTMAAFLKNKDFEWKGVKSLTKVLQPEARNSLKGKQSASPPETSRGSWLADISCAQGAARCLLSRIPSKCFSLPIFALQMPQNCRNVSCVVMCTKTYKHQQGRSDCRTLSSKEAARQNGLTSKNQPEFAASDQEGSQAHF